MIPDSPEILPLLEQYPALGRIDDGLIFADRIDRKILALLQEDATLPVADRPVNTQTITPRQACLSGSIRETSGISMAR